MEWACDHGSAVDQALHDLAERLTEPYAAQRQAMLAVREAVAAWAAEALQPLLPTEAVTRFDATQLEQRQEMVRWINGECRKFQLAVACPKTGRPSLLLVDRHTGGRAGLGSFKYENLDEQGRKVRTCHRSQLPELALVPDSPARAHPASWADRTKRSTEMKSTVESSAGTTPQASPER